MGTEDALAKTAGLIRDGKAKKIAVLTGAGISTSAGIPDFRSPETGLYDNLAALKLPYPEAVFTLDYFEARPEPFWTLAKDLYPGKYYPTPTHYFLALLHRKGLLQRVWTQNIDTLETAAGVPVDMVLEAHGSFATAHCLRCSRNASVEHVVKSGVRHGKVVKCAHKTCNGLVKPDIVFFGEGLPNEFFQLKHELFDCDLLLVIGTSLQVHPFAGLVDVVPRKTPRVLINREAVGPFERRRGSDRDSVYLGDADEGIAILAKELGWTEDLEEMMRQGRRELEEKWAEQEKLWGSGEQMGAAGSEKHKAKVDASSVAPTVEPKTEGLTIEGEKKPGEAATASAQGAAPAKVDKAEKVKKAGGAEDETATRGTADEDKRTTVEDADEEVDELADAVGRVGLGPKSKV